MSHNHPVLLLDLNWLSWFHAICKFAHPLCFFLLTFFAFFCHLIYSACFNLWVSIFLLPFSCTVFFFSPSSLSLPSFTPPPSSSLHTNQIPACFLPYSLFYLIPPSFLENSSQRLTLPPSNLQCPPSINSSSLAISNFRITLHSSQSLHYLLLFSLLPLSRVSAKKKKKNSLKNILGTSWTHS